VAAKRVAPPNKGGKSKKPTADRARAILKKRADARVMKKAEEQRRGMAATRKQQQKGRLTAEERKKVTDRDKQRRQDEMYKETQRRFWY
jgi:hypothetical protein